MLADGTGVTEVPPPDSNSMGAPSWSPDGNKLAFLGGGGPFIETINVDGTGLYNTFFFDDVLSDPEWSPDGTKIVDSVEAFGCIQVLYSIRPDGTEEGSFTPCTRSLEEKSYYPNWSPDGQRVVFSFECFGAFPPCPVGPGSRLETIRRDGTDFTALTAFDDAYARYPAWSPDGTKITFARLNFELTTARIKVINADGTNPVDLADGSEPDWQPIPINSYPRPKGATPMRFSLLPAYAPCTSANHQHGPPLAFGSCNPPVASSPHASVGTPDNNGAATNFTGYLAARTLVGNPGTPADEGDVALELSTTDVRCSFTSPPTTCGQQNNAGGPDYTGELEGLMFVTITDKDNTPNPGGPGAATVQEFDLHFTVPCTGTQVPAQIGSSCSVSTTVDALVPGAVKEGRRAIWQLDRVHVRDGGPDGDTATAGNRVFLRPGVFVP